MVHFGFAPITKYVIVMTMSVVLYCDNPVCVPGAASVQSVVFLLIACA